MLLQNWTKYICTLAYFKVKFHPFRKQTMHISGPLRLAADVFGGACVSGRSNHPSLSLRRLHFHLFASWPPVARAVRRTTQSRWARSTAAAAPQGRLGTASSPGPEPRAVPSPLRLEPHATCDATNRHVPCRLNGALPQPPAHPRHVSRVEMPVAARATLPTARPSRLVKFGIHRPTRAYRPLAGIGVVSFDNSDRVPSNRSSSDLAPSPMTVIGR